jgi:hypothetical protein
MICTFVGADGTELAAMVSSAVSWRSTTRVHRSDSRRGAAGTHEHRGRVRDRAKEMNDKYTMNKILEYMAPGKPIVHCDLTDGRFSAKQASLHARPNDVADLAVNLCELRDNSEQRATMGAIGTHRGRNQPDFASPVPRLVEASAAAMKSSPARKVPREP